MNCYKFNAFFDNNLTKHNPNYYSIENLFFHCISSGHYWRNSQILELSVLYIDKNQKCSVIKWQSENEEDEYDILHDFVEITKSFERLIGYICTCFHIPYLEAKIKAYGLNSPFTQKEHIDLLREIKSIGNHLHISTKLNDLRIFLNIPDEASEIECIAYITQLFIYDDILSGKFKIQKIEQLDENDVIITCITESELPTDIRIHDEEFYMIGSGNQLKIKIKIVDGYVKLHYSNYKDYYYLPDEQMILHKSLASAIPKAKKIRATKENCYSLISFENTLINNRAGIYQFVVSLLSYYKQK